MTWLWEFNLTTMLLLIVAAWRWGAAPERLCVAVIVFMNLGDRLYHAVIDRGTIYASVDLGHLFIDVTAAAVFIGVALSANRVYPLWLSAFQLVSVISHFAREVDAKLVKSAYGLMTYGPFYFILLILAGGIWMHARRVKRYGPYPPWRTSSSPSRAASQKLPPTG
ncbi:hypothetical protein L7H23_03645 [Sphingopyxis sp. BSN-002]|uniref:hypothetical protein n=1 Tax=Sphingopyxis sp. BSN-002 TaxID=2911495 RepID=UPI001EDC061D|nr:hypothetical protein [Sphingopyxis sp. BSN-002]UKK85218.1 hypothetical protein L7H23_03645 [Sphingopyxis sp. BSN-002]